nr:hypothetical protein Iba_chr13cCG1960 [Ipomoea batatas]GMD80488.1 hypothetical protein Iba_chr13eCG2360 [Ipomoea batatas]
MQSVQTRFASSQSRTQCDMLSRMPLPEPCKLKPNLTQHQSCLLICIFRESGSVFLNPDDILFRNPRGEIKGSVLIVHGEAYEEGERITSRGARGKVLLAMGQKLYLVNITEYFVFGFLFPELNFDPENRHLTERAQSSLVSQRLQL